MLMKQRFKKFLMVLSAVVAGVFLCLYVSGLFVNLARARGQEVSPLSGEYGIARLPSGAAILVRRNSIIVPQNVTIITQDDGSIMGVSEEETSVPRHASVVDPHGKVFPADLPPRIYFRIDVQEHSISWFRDAELSEAIRELPDRESQRLLPVRSEIR